MLPQELKHLYSILVSFLGESKNKLDDSLQCEFPCPRCRENHGEGEDMKYNLSVSLKKQVFQCWKCCSHDDDMHGSIKKLFRLYGNKNLWDEYKNTIEEFQKTKYFSLNFSKEEFDKVLGKSESKEIELPVNYKKLTPKEKYNYTEQRALNYLFKRGITWEIINRFSIGYTSYDEKHKQLSSRIVIPSYDENGDLNYWTSRDFLCLEKRRKYFNPEVERKNMIFNECKISWDSDITLVEGPFDSIVVPNSIPLLGKVLKDDFKLFKTIINKCNANINIFLDNDAEYDAQKLYEKLNSVDKLKGKIRIISVKDGFDPSLIFEKYGKRGIINCLKNAHKLI